MLVIIIILCFTLYFRTDFLFANRNEQEVWPPGSADRVCPRQPLMTQVQHCAKRRLRLITLFRQLHWLNAAEQINYKLALLVYECRQGVAPPYLADELCQPASDTEARCRLRSASALLLIVRRTRLSTLGDRAFPVAAPRISNSLR